MPKRTYAPKRGRKRKRFGTKTRYTKRRRTPRSTIRSSPFAAANVYHFKRSYDHPFAIGGADSANGVYLNTDSKYLIVKLHTKFNKLPDYTEFKALFSEYKITSVTHRLVPYYSNNQPSNQYTGSIQSVAIPNYEVFGIPVNSSARERELETLSASEIDSYLNQSQRKSRRLMPSRIQRYTTKRPKVVGYKGPADKDGGNALMVMQGATYLNTDPSPLITNGIDQTDVAHYGITLLIRRVDGTALPTHGAGDPNLTNMGFRMENTVFFKCRKVQ